MSLRSAPSTTPTSKASACCCASTSTCRCENGKVTDATRIERVAPTITRDRRQGRQGHPAGAFRPAQGPRSEAIAGAGRGGAGASDRAGRSLSPRTASARSPTRRSPRCSRGDILCLENTRFHEGEEKNDRGTSSPSWPSSATSMSTTPSPPRIARMPRPRALGASAAGLCRPRHAGRARCAGEGARHPAAAGGGDRRRRQGFHQARSARQPARQGRDADHRRRHGQHLPRRARQSDRQVAVREATSSRPRATSWPRPKATSGARSCCRSTRWWRRSSPRMRRRASSRSMQSAPTT